MLGVMSAADVGARVAQAPQMATIFAARSSRAAKPLSSAFASSWIFASSSGDTQQPGGSPFDIFSAALGGST